MNLRRRIKNEIVQSGREIAQSAQENATIIAVVTAPLAIGYGVMSVASLLRGETGEAAGFSAVAILMASASSLSLIRKELRKGQQEDLMPSLDEKWREINESLNRTAERPEGFKR